MHFRADLICMLIEWCVYLLYIYITIYIYCIVLHVLLRSTTYYDPCHTVSLRQNVSNLPASGPRLCISRKVWWADLSLISGNFHCIVVLASKFQLNPQKKSIPPIPTTCSWQIYVAVPCDLSPSQHLLDDSFAVPGSPLQGSTDLASSFGTSDVHPMDYATSKPFFLLGRNMGLSENVGLIFPMK